MFNKESGELDIKRIVQFVALTLGVILFGYAIWYIFSNGGLRVKSDASNSQITVFSEETGRTVSSGSTGDLMFLPIGKYVVNVQSGQKQIRTYIAVERFAIKELSLTPPELLVTEPVTNISIGTYAVSDDSLSIFDAEKSQLVAVSSNNVFTKTDLSLRYDTVMWQSPGNGYAVTRPERENTRQFVRIIDGKPQPFATPSPFTSQTYLAFNVTPEGKLYVLQDGTLYTYTGSSYVKVGSYDKNDSIISVDDTYLSLLSRGEESCKIQIIALKSKNDKTIPLQCQHSPDYTYVAQWSSDYKLLAVTTGSSLNVYDNKYNLLYTAPDSKASNPIWLTNKTFAYVSDNNVWKYNLETKTASVLGALPRYATVQSVTKLDNSDALYFTARTDSTEGLYRLVDGKKDTINVTKINESNMHELSNYCRIRFVNYTRLEIAASTAKGEEPACKKDIENYFSAIQVPVPPIQFDTTEFNFPIE